MKKKVITGICLLLVIVLLFPIPLRMKDGGTVKYQAVLYSISDVHRLAPSTESGYEEGFVIEILGMQVFDNVKRSIEKQYAIAPHFTWTGKDISTTGSSLMNCLRAMNMQPM